MIRLARFPALYGEITENRAAESDNPTSSTARTAGGLRRAGKPPRSALRVFARTERVLREKRQNALRLKSALMEEAEGDRAATETKPWVTGIIELFTETLAAMEENS